MIAPNDLTIGYYVRRMERCIAEAEEHGIILSTKRVACEPLAMGNAVTIVEHSLSHAVYRDPQNQ